MVNLHCEILPYGVIYFDFDGICFPDEEWDDFVKYLIHDWHISLHIDADSHFSEFKLWFMDGPYYLSCQKKDSILEIQTVDHDIVGEPISHYEVDYFDFMKQVDQVYDALAKIPEIKKLWDREKRHMERWKKKNGIK